MQTEYLNSSEVTESLVYRDLQVPTVNEVNEKYLKLIEIGSEYAGYKSQGQED